MASSTKSRASKLWPVPEILEGEGNFTLKETAKRNGMVCTDLVGKTMYVPTTADAFGRMGRMHEMAHVAITPTEGMQLAQANGIEPDYMNVAEDMRVNIFLQRRFELEASIPEELFLHALKGYILNDDLKGMTLMAVACRGLPEYNTLMNFADRERSDWYYEVRDVVERCEGMFYPTSFEQAMEVAKYLQGLFDANAKALAKAVQEAIDEADMPESVAEWLKGKSYGEGDEPDLEWGTMEIRRPALTERMAERRLNRRIKPQEMGSSMMFPSRLDVDDKIFGNMKRVAQGTVLIDVSGSMSMEAKDIKEMIQAAPGVTVACYSGNGDGTGHLTIVAAKGAMMKLPESYRWPMYNEVDGPALEWLTRQSGPRVWVCDGDVTGKEDRSSKKLTLEAFKIVKDNKIRRTGDITETSKLLKK